MNNLNKHFILATAFIMSANIFSQSAPTTPEPPETESSSSYSYSISVDDEDESIHVDNNTITHSSSVSVTKSDDLYKFKASFDKSKTELVKKVIIDKLGKVNFNSKISTYRWIKKGTSDKAFECTLTKGRVRIYLNSDEVSSSFQHKIEVLGDELKHVISGSNHKESAKRDAAHAKRDLEHARRDLERAQRDLERAKRELERSKKKN